MSGLSVYWEHAAFDRDAGMVMREDDHSVDPESIQTAVRQGVLTDQHSAVVERQPVLVEAVTERVYTSADLPPGTVVYVTGRPEAGGLIEMATRSGFDIRSADDKAEMPRQSGERNGASRR